MYMDNVRLKFFVDSHGWPKIARHGQVGNQPTIGL